MKSIYTFIDERLQERLDNSLFRTLPLQNKQIDFCSNDYLGFARSQELKSLVEKQLKEFPEFSSGSTGSRLISGNQEFTEKLEQKIALFHKAEASLIFNSGYDANVGLFSSLPQRGDTIILDEFAHASIIDGARLSNANRYTFKHSDLNSLEQKLKLAKGNIFIGIESIYSMDGDEAPLKGIVDLAEAYGAAVIVDEAHAVGIFGVNGQGLVEHYGLSDKVLARIVTFGKALGCHGAAVLSNYKVRNFLINYARSFIYTTAASFYTHASVNIAYNLLNEVAISLIHQKIHLFKKEAAGAYGMFIQGFSPIQSLVIAGNERAKNLANTLQTCGFNVKAILHPTVPQGKERLRICLHTFNSDDEIIKLTKAIKANL